MKPGIYDNISNADYHGGPGISKSGLDLIARSPLHYDYAKNEESADEETNAAFLLGQLAHTLTLEPDKFKNEFVIDIKNSLDRRKKDDKAKYAEFLETVNGRTLIDQAQFDQASAMAVHVREDENARPFIVHESTIIENSVYWEIDGVLCKCRPDIWPRELNIVGDLKTTVNASPEGFAKSCANYRYHVQAAWYMDGIEAATGTAPTHFVFIAVEKLPPYAVGVYVMDEQSIRKGRELYRRDFETYKRCLESNTWPGYPFSTLTLPAWALR